MKKLKYPIIIVDFDDTIYWYDKDTYPMCLDQNINKEAFNVLKECKARGQKLILHTCRTGLALKCAVNFCSKFGLEFDAINQDVSEAVEEWRKRVPHSAMSFKPWGSIVIDNACWPNNVKGIDWYLLGLELAKYEEIENEEQYTSSNIS